MYRTLLDQIRERILEHGGMAQPPCPTEKLAELRRQANRKLAFDLPRQYLAFLSINDGLLWNGLCVFASERGLIANQSDTFIDGCVERNIEEREFDDRMFRYFVFAEDGEVSFSFNILDDRYEVVSRVGRHVDERFDSFDSLLALAMRNHI